MLYDKLFPLEEAPTCPNLSCGAEMKLLRNSRNEDMSQAILKYECPYCHYRMTISTRNNRRMDTAILGGTFAVSLALALGMCIEYASLVAQKLIIHA